MTRRPDLHAVGSDRADVHAAFSSITDVVADIADGKLVIVVDDFDRENEGDLVCAAEKVTPEIVNFMVTHARGLVCTPLTGDRLDQLAIPQMVTDNTESHETAFCVAVDSKHNTTGISALDRAQTIRALVDPASKPEDFRRPGHTFPLRYTEGGVLRRAGHTEAAVDLARLAGLAPAGVICEIMGEDGTMARLPELTEFARSHGLKMISIAEIIRYRRQSERLVQRIAEARIPTEFGDFRCVGYRSILDGTEHLAFVKGEVSGEDDVLVRVHSECLTGDVFGSKRCDCGLQLREALRIISEEGRGVLLYFRGHEGRGIGIMHKLQAYSLQDLGRDTVEANEELGFKPDQREYGIGAQILVDLGVTTMRLLTNNPAKRAGIEGYGLHITGRVPLVVHPNPENIEYLRAKRAKLGHLLDGLEERYADFVLGADAGAPLLAGWEGTGAEDSPMGGGGASADN
jgi:3,4-dihydroxy 2-butanone 4-phosphate synthase/GTP cyclohydrolase II